ncbi:hypothetical protein DPSP01_001276 [Paraphaeosphaeria sporulosa]|uniref:Fungal N-terminal domain-containing protein n=1 Tax=Paraphaeosphaeria sporulosa TaxID=1460663 RepID=A0A177BYX4_9PLEO|nr:uncharacterized protein CC84DRAFT_1155318 [Paraphaeosphaeria sporulosa]OAG00475.1 hypothetical protein CC84DRAFT_1155318 [Paraphaeosphaeria sporulosa]
MAVLAAILPLVSQSSALALVLYRLAAVDAYAAKELLRAAKAISNLALIVKEVGTIIKEDDRLPSAEAFETIEDILDQTSTIFNEIDLLVSGQDAQRKRRSYDEHQDGNQAPTLTPQMLARLHYLDAHLDSLRTTLSVMLQTLYTAQSIMWARVRPTVSPRQCATAVANEKQQLETLIIDQQISILQASKLYERARPDARLLMENDSSLSLSIVDENAPSPASLARYQDKFIATLDTQSSDEQQWLASVCGISKSQLDRLLDRWTRLHQFEEELLDAERKVQAKKRETQQPFVESDSEDDINPLPKFGSSGVGLDSHVPHRPDAIPPLFTESSSLQTPKSTTHQNCTVPASPRSSISTLPVEAAAAVEAKDKDVGLDLEIPWTLRTRRYYWKYVDGKVQESNTDAPSSEAFAHRHSWTEVQASWVCKEALQESGYSHTQVQKEIPDGRRTKFETWFCIDQPLTFDQVQHLVERTVELYRKTQPPSPPLVRERTRRTSFERRTQGYVPPDASNDRDRTPIPPQARPPPLERSTTAYHISQPPPLDRALSMPGQAAPSYPPNPRSSNIHLPPPSPRTSNPQIPPPQATPIPIPPHPSTNPSFLAPSPRSTRSFVPPTPYQPPPPPPRHLQPPMSTYGQSPLRASLDGARYEHYSSTSGASDSESVTRSRKRDGSRRRRRGSDERRRKKGHGHGKAGALMGVAGLTALLDGLVGI